MAIPNWMKNKKGLKQSSFSFLLRKSYNQRAPTINSWQHPYNVPNLDNDFQNAIVKKKQKECLYLEHCI